MAPIEELALLDFDRSNKGASKQRRDQINAEIATIRDLLPLPESSRQRLSQLQIMSLSCVYIRKCNVLQKLFRSKSQEMQLPDSLDFFQALTGFLLVTTREGKLLYISENVTDFLGHSMVDMKTQGDSLYDIVDKRDHSCIQAQLMRSCHQGPKDDVSFFCRMNMSRTLKRQSGFGDVKVMHVRGHFMNVTGTSDTEGQSVFMATCSPLVTPDLKENLVQNNTMVFKTVHQLDMTFMEATKTAEYHLGCSTEELCGKSWYSMLHPEDIHEGKEKHMQLIRSNHEMGCMMTVRMLKADGDIFWVNIVMHVRQASLTQNEEPYIVCINQVINAQEAKQIKSQGHTFSMYPNRAHELWAGHMPNTQMGQEHSQGHWVQQSGNNSVPVPGYQATIPGFVTQTGRSPTYPMCAPPMVNLTGNGQPSQDLQHYSGSTTVMQTDQLKAMLKRKIQGPHQGSCRPVKMTKMSWDVDGSGGGHSFTEMDRAIPFTEQYTHTVLPVQADCQGQTMHFVKPSHYSVGVVTAKKSPDMMKAHLSKASAQLLPKTSTSISEQVVPDVNVPESYLTPDPSPVSSPEPSNVIVKTEVMDPDEVSAHEKCSMSILQALERLASLPQATMKKEDVAAQKAPQMSQVKDPAMNMDIGLKRKELPIFDAFEIDNFFDKLCIPKPETKATVKVENLPDIKPNIKTEIIEENQPKTSATDFLMLKSTTMPAADPYVLAKPLQHQHHLTFPQTQPSLQRQLDLSSSQMVSSPVYPHQVQLDNVKTPAPSLPSFPQKDLVVSSTMVFSPRSIKSPEMSVGGNEAIDDLLSCFSEDGLDLSPLQMDPNNAFLDRSMTDNFVEEAHIKSPFSDRLLQVSNCKAAEELSPQSSSSPLASEDELTDDGSTLTLAMALDALDAETEVSQAPQISSIKDRDVLGMSEEMNHLDFFLNSLLPSEVAVPSETLKPGQ